MLQYVLKRTFFFSFFLNLWRKKSTSQGKPKVLIILTRKFPAEKILISNPFSTMTKFLGILESLSKIATWIKCLGFYVAKKRLDYTTGNLQYIACNFIWFTLAKLQTICPFWKDISLAKSPYWFRPSQGSIIPNNPEFFEALFSPWLHL